MMVSLRVRSGDSALYFYSGDNTGFGLAVLELIRADNRCLAAGWFDALPARIG